MNIQTIRKLQKENDLAEIQALIDSGQVWHFEGSMGRYAMDLLTCGACMLPLEGHKDYYGNYVPGRNELQKGTKGTFQNSVRYWTENA